MGQKFVFSRSFWGITAVIFFALFVASGCIPSSPDLPLSVNDNQPPPQAVSQVIPSEKFIPANQANNESPTPQIRRVSNNYTFTGSLPAQAADEHTFWAEAEQIVAAQLNGSHSNISFEIYDIFNQKWGFAQGSDQIFITLPHTGDYIVRVIAPEVAGTYGYSLELTLTKLIEVIPSPTAVPTLPPLEPPPTLPGASATTLAQSVASQASQPTVSLQPIRIEFDPATSSQTIPGQLTANQPKQYVFAGTAGQLLAFYVSTSQPGLEISIAGQDKIVIDVVASGEPFSRILPSTQAYFLTITSQIADANQNYTLTLSVIGEADSSPPPPDTIVPKKEDTEGERISIPEGYSTIKLEGVLSPQTSKTYVLKTQNGERVTIDATPDDSNMTILVRGADGTEFSWVLPNETFSEIVPLTQDYFISLTPPKGSSEINYVLSVSVDTPQE